MELYNWVKDLSSASPAPGGGGASALVGALAAALGSMVGHLTDGKKKYAAYNRADFPPRLRGIFTARNPFGRCLDG